MIFMFGASSQIRTDGFCALQAHALVHLATDACLERHERIELYVLRTGVEAQRLHQLDRVPHLIWRLGSDLNRIQRNHWVQ